MNKLNCNDEVLNDFLCHMKFYSHNYNSIDELDYHYKLVRCILFETIIFLKKQSGKIFKDDYAHLSSFEHHIDRCNFVTIIYSILDYFRNIYGDVIMLENIDNLCNYYKV